MSLLLKKKKIIDRFERESEREGKRWVGREREGEKERERDLLAILLTHASVSCFLYVPDWESNPQPWHIETTL